MEALRPIFLDDRKLEERRLPLALKELFRLNELWPNELWPNELVELLYPNELVELLCPNEL